MVVKLLLLLLLSLSLLILPLHLILTICNICLVSAAQELLSTIGLKGEGSRVREGFIRRSWLVATEDSFNANFFLKDEWDKRW